MYPLQNHPFLEWKKKGFSLCRTKNFSNAQDPSQKKKSSPDNTVPGFCKLLPDSQSRLYRANARELEVSAERNKQISWGAVSLAHGTGQSDGKGQSLKAEFLPRRAVFGVSFFFPVCYFIRFLSEMGKGVFFWWKILERNVGLKCGKWSFDWMFFSKTGTCWHKNSWI